MPPPVATPYLLNHTSVCFTVLDACVAAVAEAGFGAAMTTAAKAAHPAIIGVRVLGIASSLSSH